MKCRVEVFVRHQIDDKTPDFAQKFYRVVVVCFSVASGHAVKQQIVADYRTVLRKKFFVHFEKRDVL